MNLILAAEARRRTTHRSRIFKTSTCPRRNNKFSRKPTKIYWSLQHHPPITWLTWHAVTCEHCTKMQIMPHLHEICIALRLQNYWSKSQLVITSPITHDSRMRHVWRLVARKLAKSMIISTVIQKSDWWRPGETHKKSANEDDGPWALIL